MTLSVTPYRSELLPASKRGFAWHGFAYLVHIYEGIANCDPSCLLVGWLVNSFAR